jgi:hypothetical protein
MTAKTLFEDVVERAVAERARRAASKNLITRDEAHAELSPMGMQRWYLHPRLDEPSTQALSFTSWRFHPGHEAASCGARAESFISCWKGPDTRMLMVTGTLGSLRI